MSTRHLLLNHDYESGYNVGHSDASARVPFKTEHRRAAQMAESWALGYVDGYADAVSTIPAQDFLKLLGLPLLTGVIANDCS